MKTGTVKQSVFIFFVIAILSLIYGIGFQSMAASGQTGSKNENQISYYGEVKKITSIRSCPFCGITMQETNAEYMIPSADKIRNSEKISQELRSFAENAEEDNMIYASDELYIEKDGCTHDAELVKDFNIYNLTVDETIEKAGIIDDKYFYVNYSDYIYVFDEGMCSTTQFIFDMDTGKKVSFKDLYTGKENEFKKIVAEAVKRDYESYKKGEEPYLQTSAEEVYKVASDYVRIEGRIIFYEDGIEYTFGPHVLDLYDTKIYIPYKDIFGREHLVE